MHKLVHRWRQIQGENFTSVEELTLFLELSPNQKTKLIQNPRFPLNIPRRLAEKIQKGTLEDPILRQFIPLKEEYQTEDFEKDPVKDAIFRRASKLLHKYEGRALLLCTSACAMNCRFCFRQNFDYETVRHDYTSELALLKTDSSIKEIILSGGDPLTLGNRTLRLLIEELNAIPHLQRLRFHTRFPIGIPERIDEEFLAILKSTRLQTWFILHCNHPLELDFEVVNAMKKIQKLGIPVLTQSVLLKGVNDSVEILRELFEKLVDNGIQPYYLHQLDRVSGSQHFEVDDNEGRALLQALSKVLSGYALPRYVKEIPGEPSKTLL